MGHSDPKEWGIEIDLDQITIEELPELSRDWDRAIEERHDAPLYKWAAKCIIRWDFKSDPHDPASYPKLGLRQHKEVMGRFASEFLEFMGFFKGFREGDVPALSGSEQSGNAIGDEGDGGIS